MSVGKKSIWVSVERMYDMIFVIGGAYQGKSEYVKNNYKGTHKIIDSYQLEIRKELEQGMDPLKETEKLLRNIPENTVIVSNELGSGLVPVDSFDRNYREINGRVNCLIAKEAEEVIRVICGIGSRIK